MEIDEIRRINTRDLAESEKYRSDFARKIGKSTSQVNNWIGPTYTKNINGPSARNIEERYGKPRGWLDNLHDEKDSFMSIPIITWESILNNFDPTNINSDEPLKVYEPPLNAFALQIKDDSMSPKLPIGQYVVISPHALIEDGNLALVCINNVVKIRQLVDSMTWLKPINDQWQMEKNDGLTLGKAVSLYLPEI